MLDIDERIAAWRIEIMNALEGREELAEELEDHLRENFARYRAENFSPEESFILAAARMGEVKAIANQFNRVGFKERRNRMKILRIIVTTVLGSYLLAMGLQLIAVTCAVLQELAGFVPHTRGAPSVFFSNLLVCSLSAVGIWATWRVNRQSKVE